MNTNSNELRHGEIRVFFVHKKFKIFFSITPTYFSKSSILKTENQKTKKKGVNYEKLQTGNRKAINPKYEEGLC